MYRGIAFLLFDGKGRYGCSRRREGREGVNTPDKSCKQTTERECQVSQNTQTTVVPFSEWPVFVHVFLVYRWQGGRTFACVEALKPVAESRADRLSIAVTIGVMVISITSAIPMVRPIVPSHISSIRRIGKVVAPMLLCV